MVINDQPLHQFPTCPSWFTMHLPTTYCMQYENQNSPVGQTAGRRIENVNKDLAVGLRVQ